MGRSAPRTGERSGSVAIGQMDGARVAELAAALRIALADGEATAIADALTRRIEDLRPLDAISDVENGGGVEGDVDVDVEGDVGVDIEGDVDVDAEGDVGVDLDVAVEGIAGVDAGVDAGANIGFCFDGADTPDSLPAARELTADELTIGPADVAPTAVGGFITFPRSN